MPFRLRNFGLVANHRVKCLPISEEIELAVNNFKDLLFIDVHHATLINGLFRLKIEACVVDFKISAIITEVIATTRFCKLN